MIKQVECIYGKEFGEAVYHVPVPINHKFTVSLITRASLDLMNQHRLEPILVPNLLEISTEKSRRTDLKS